MAISFNNIPSQIRVPLFYAEMDNSMANTATSIKQAVLIGFMADDAEAKENSPLLVSTVSKAKEWFGRGSQLALEVEAYRDQDSTGILYAVAQKPSESAAAATGTVTLAGTALKAGTVALYVGGEKVAVDVALGDTAAQVAAAMVAAVSADKDLPVTAAKGESTEDGDTVVNFTAKSKGAWGNEIRLATNLKGLAGGEADVSGLAVTISQMANGSGSVDYEKAFAALGDETFQYIGIPEADATSLDAAKDVMNDSTGRWSYAKMQYGHVFACKRGTSEDLVTFGKTRNDQHATVFGIEPEFPDASWKVMAAALGREAAYITIDPARPTQTGPLNGLTAPAVESRFTMNERNTLLYSGIATLYVNAGTVRIERAVTTYRVNAFGDADNSYLDSETLFTLAEVTTRLKTAITSKYPRHKLASDGTRYGAGQAIVTPSVIRSELIAQYAAMETDGLVENAELFAKYLIVERNTSDPNRIDVLLPPDLVNQLRIFALQNQFRLQYPENA